MNTRSPSPSWSTLAAWLLLSLSAGCTERKPLERECTYDDECEEGLLCAGGVCRQPCLPGGRCPLQYRCISTGTRGLTACVPNGGPVSCVSDYACGDGARCLPGANGGVCGWICRNDADCAPYNAGPCDLLTRVCARIPQVSSSVPPPKDAGFSDAPLDAAVDAVADMAMPDVTVDGAVPDGATDTSVDAPVDAAVDADARRNVGPDGRCLTGFADCDGDTLNGCERDVRNDPSNCGACGHACTMYEHVSVGVCRAGSCAIGTCATTWRDCDGALANGCEVDVSGDARHCGGCGNVCPGTNVCRAGVCATPVFPVPAELVNEGDFAPPADAGVVRLSAGEHRFRSMTIPEGVEVQAQTVGRLEIWVDGDVRIDGTINLSGGRGGHSGANTTARPGGGGMTGIPVQGSDQPVDGGCPAAAGGGDGSPGGDGEGNPDFASSLRCSVGGAQGGGAGGALSYTGGGGGGGVAGGGGGSVRTARGGRGGGTGLGPIDGLDGGLIARGGGAELEGSDAGLGVYAGGAGVPPCSTSGGSGAGGSIGVLAASDLAVRDRTSIRTGSGGGGGAAILTAAGGGGGGGGGALLLATTGRLLVGPRARLLADGGAGGEGRGSAGEIRASERAAPGGGGSGGLLAFRAASVVIPATATFSVRGGDGGISRDGVCTLSGGHGGLGRIRIWTRCAASSIAFSFNGRPARCVPAGTAPTPGEAYVADDF